VTDAAGLKEPPQSLWGILKSIGPGLILTANIVGTGELIATTRLGSQVGFLLLWFIIFACLIKVFVQVELGRYTISEGVSSLEILRRLPTVGRFRWAVLFWFFMYVGTLFQMAAMVGGVAELFARSQEVRATLPWALGAACLAAGLLWINRYKLIEQVSTWMVVAFTLINLLAVFLMQRGPFAVTGADLAHGFSLGLPRNANGLDLATAFAVFGITGVGAAELMFYPIWCLEKGYARAVGPRDDSPAWEARAKGWLRVMRWDAWLSMLVYTAGTVSFYLLGASLLARQGKVLGDKNPMDTLQEIYTLTFGSAGVWIFIVGAFMVLYSTFFVSTASNARLFADVTGMMGLHRSPEERAKWVRWGVVGIPVFTLLTYYIMKAPVTLVMIGGTAQALMLPFLGFAALWFHRQVPASIRARAPWTFFLVLSFLAMALLGAYQAAKALGFIT
jgi:Mn2+/Fe2+ NRAMP family transporter